MGCIHCNDKPLGYGGVKQVLERVKEVTGLDGVRLSAHTFRHTFARCTWKKGGEVFKLSREMGHSSAIRQYDS